MLIPTPPSIPVRIRNNLVKAPSTVSGTFLPSDNHLTKAYRESTMCQAGAVLGKRCLAPPYCQALKPKPLDLSLTPFLLSHTTRAPLLTTSTLHPSTLVRTTTSLTWYLRQPPNVSLLPSLAPGPASSTRRPACSLHRSAAQNSVWLPPQEEEPGSSQRPTRLPVVAQLLTALQPACLACPALRPNAPPPEAHTAFPHLLQGIAKSQLPHRASLATPRNPTPSPVRPLLIPTLCSTQPSSFYLAPSLLIMLAVYHLFCSLMHAKLLELCLANSRHSLMK